MSIDLSSKFNRSDAEANWSEFLSWIGFSVLVDALDRKSASMEDWSSFQRVAPKLFSIELGLAKILKSWRSTKKLWFPKEKSKFDAHSFVASCMQIKRQLDENRSHQFRRRIISELLPSGRLCHLDHEFRLALNLIKHGWLITQYGFCGDPGPDFVAQRGRDEIEMEGKCLSPEIGLCVSYEFATRLFARLSRELKGLYANKFVTIRIEISGELRDPDKARDQILRSYEMGEGVVSDAIKVSVSFGSLVEFISQFPNTSSDTWLDDVFSKHRTREGDYGYIIRRDRELIFFNLVPLKANKQTKNILKLISTTCERQFSGNRPALLWLHFQALDARRVDSEPDGVDALFERLARHAFRNEKRNHLCALACSSDSDIEIEPLRWEGRDVRAVASSGKVRGFDNMRCKFGQVPIFTPFFKPD